MRYFKAVFRFEFIYIIIHFLCFNIRSDGRIAKIRFTMEFNRRVSDLSVLKKISARSVSECVVSCSKNTKCFLATLNRETQECLIGNSGCSLSNTVPLISWNTFHKSGKVF